ncbi:hypothetical protein DSO57_1022674 [Entomophthora muscae]|uniref:Uncharacterized protein n=1 Tax=Entomophthora muscae TaxID=34485 RepID=A0ACC2SS17_9FUNG|nr:hypothetical protein DSO57_1022674 [Entomophthora muscae]
MGAKSKTKSRGRPPKTPTRITRSTTCPPPVSDQENEPARSSPEPNGDPNPDPTGPEWHSASQLNSPTNQDQTQSNPDLLQNNQSDYRAVRNRPTSSDSSRSHLSASPPRGNEASRVRLARRPRGRSGGPSSHQSLSKTEIEILEGRGVKPADLELWIELQFNFTQVDKWIRAEFNPIDAQHWEAAGFSPACANIWRKAGIDLQWAKMFRQLRMRTSEAKPWMQLSPHSEEVLTAIQNKLPLKDAEVWVSHKFNLYEATEYFLGFVPSEVAGEIKTLNMRAQDVTEYFSSFRIPSLAIGWAKSGFSVEAAKSWS